MSECTDQERERAQKTPTLVEQHMKQSDELKADRGVSKDGDIKTRKDDYPEDFIQKVESIE